jgi:hypothetical protein
VQYLLQNIWHPMLNW